MKFLIPSDTFARAVTWTARTLPQRPVAPVLAGLRLHAADGHVSVAAFDYEVAAHTAEDADVQQEGTVLVSGRMLAHIAARLPAGDLQVVLDGPQLILSCGRARFTQLTMPVEDYPTLPDMPEAAGTVYGREFARAAAQTLIAASHDDTVPMLTGVKFDFDGPALTLSATDRYRVALREVSWEPALETAAGFVVVPGRILGEVVKTMNDDAPLTLGLAKADKGGPHSIGFQIGGRHLISRLLENEFVNERKLIPTQFSAHAHADTEALTEAVRRVAVTAERSTPVRLSFTPGQDTDLELAAGTGDEATGADVIPATFTGSEPMTLAFNPQFLIDALAALDSSTAHLAITTETTPAVVTAARLDECQVAYRHLIMPIRLAG